MFSLFLGFGYLYLKISQGCTNEPDASRDVMGGGVWKAVGGRGGGNNRL
jgi:hypothetical protein